MNKWIDRRRSAVLLHITSLPGPFHKGVLGAEAFSFIDSLVSGGFTVWQFLPLGPTHSHGSPYESLSTFACNPELIDLRDCVASGWLNANDLQTNISAAQHKRLRHIASYAFWHSIGNDPELQQAVAAFQHKHAHWLEDYALFSALKEVSYHHAWWQWPIELRDRQPEAITAAKEEHAPLIQQVIFEQFLFDRQWHSLKAYAEQCGVQLFGDLPIYVAHDSSDVWANPEFFTINDIGLCNEVAGVPPDYFSETGQRWGNPLYHWESLENNNFKWWVNRVRRQLELTHMLRIDHFLALEAFWVIPGESEDGMIGEWRKAPGRALLKALQQQLGELPLIAEDLGIITSEVTALRQDFGLPGMKILQFAFGGDDQNPYLPHNHETDSVTYTGTHDNDTTAGWFNLAKEQVREHAMRILNTTEKNITWTMIETALASPALLSVIPMQDLLELGSEARFNTPGTLGENWQWRMQPESNPQDQHWQRAHLLHKKHNR